MEDTKRASLPERHELKYFINPGDLAMLRYRLKPVLKLDRHCAGPDRSYAIRSLYLDDVQDSAYYDKQMGVAHRDKYRIRIYNYSDQVIFLERKRKQGDLIQKSSVRITRNLAERIIEGSCAGLEKTGVPLLMDLYAEMRLHLLRARVIVDYDREAYVHPAENVRITFDKRVRSGLHSTDLFDPSLPTVRAIQDGREVLEVKFDRYMPDFISALLHGVPAERSAISKYVLCRQFEPLDTF
ncbi:MAG: polyphosphate polymerase domain-containing protein [Clostridia bacterium]|nr:polyphosphate polymerase domain-containing protein [Clostridia bacterium]